MMWCVVRWCVSDVEVLGWVWRGGWWMTIPFLVLECLCDLGVVLLRLRIVLTEMLL